MNNLSLEPITKLSNFHADLAMSDSEEIEQAINRECRKYFPELLGITKAHKLNDMKGADYFLEFENCKMETLDIKVRSEDYSVATSKRAADNRTACIEIIANIGTNKIGWSLDKTKQTDWIMFYYIDTGRSHFYPARLLRSAVIKYLPELRKQGKAAIQTTGSGNGSYKSESLFLSHRELWVAIYNSSNMRDNKQ